MPGVLVYLEVMGVHLEWLIDFKPNKNRIGMTTKYTNGTENDKTNLCLKSNGN